MAGVNKNDDDNDENHDDNDHNDDNSNDDDNDDDDHEGLIVGGLGGGRLAARAEQLSEVSEVRGKLELISRGASYTFFYPFLSYICAFSYVFHSTLIQESFPVLLSL